MIPTLRSADILSLRGQARRVIRFPVHVGVLGVRTVDIATLSIRSHHLSLFNFLLLLLLF